MLYDRGNKITVPVPVALGVLPNFKLARIQDPASGRCLRYKFLGTRSIQMCIDYFRLRVQGELRTAADCI